jgi:serine/threonine protein phosphatase PrpC
MYFINGLTQFINRVGIIMRNPLRPVIQSFSPWLNRLRGLFRSVRNPRYLFAPFSRLGQALKGLGGRNPYIRDMLDSIADYRFARQQRHTQQYFLHLAEKSDYSQIHLVNQSNRQRTVVHIGTTIGRSEAHIVLKGTSHEPVELRFKQVNPQKYHGPILLEYIAGVSALQVDGAEMTESAPLQHGSTLVIDKQSYRCELYAWDQLPPVAYLDAAWMTSVGPVRYYNEDAIGIYQHPRATLFAVADGVGGAEAGELVSEFTVQYLLAAFHENVKYDFDWHEVFRVAVDNINREVRRFARLSAFATGTTLTAVVVQGWDAYIVHVGDSRLYLWNAGTLRQVTTDHSRLVTPSGEEAKDNNSPAMQVRTVLVKAVGKRDTIEVDLITLRLQPGDRLLLCSDGLNEQVKGEELVEALATISAAKLPEHLIKLANDRQNTDNISVIALEAQTQNKGRDHWRATPGPRVYVGYNPMWTLRLRPPQDLATRVPVTQRVGPAFRTLVAIAVLGAVFLFGLVLVLDGGRGRLLGADKGTPITILTDTPRPSATLTPTRTPTLTPTPTIARTPPTSTLRPLPTSTLITAGDSSGRDV